MEDTFSPMSVCGSILCRRQHRSQSADTGDDTEVSSGLTEGQQVVASGQFLIDSEASLKSVLPRLEGSSGTGPGAPAPASSQVPTRSRLTKDKTR
ncbi:hypothetical protein F6X42_18875 [Paraburkholderia sp. WC7.3b]|uniref:Uncharacterized protein n=1 Tax=Paraburkholderia podalyriae TaxID=1938811 RepID=A0ABR7PQN2_9BURK|nr:hypothetical protein [Paraburkholderia podalyriae]